jgi:hypothetical protein
MKRGDAVADHNDIYAIAWDFLQPSSFETPLRGSSGRRLNSRISPAYPRE